MPDVASLIVRVGAQTRDLEAAFARSTRKVEAFADATSSIGARMSVITAGVGVLGGAVISATARFDALNKGLESVAGSAEEAERQFQRLREIAKAPGIDLEQAVKGSIQLQAVGASAALAERTLRNVGRAVAASAGGPDQFAGVNRQLQQIAGKGKILAQDLNIIKENAPAMAKALQAAFGATTAEGIEKLNLSTEEFFNRLNEGIEKAIPKVEGGLGNAITNLRSSVSQAFASLGSGQANELTKTIDRLALRIEGAALAFSRLSPTTQRWTLYAIGATAALGPLLIALSALATAYRTIIALSLVNTTVASTRAFLAMIPTIYSAGSALTVFGTGARMAAAALVGPAGIALALGYVVTQFVRARIASAEALQAIRENIAKMNQATAQATLNVSVAAVRELNSELVALQSLVDGMGAGRGTRMGALPKERARILQIEGQIRSELDKQRAAAERINALRAETSLGTGTTTGNSFPDTQVDVLAKANDLADQLALRLEQGAAATEQILQRAVQALAQRGSAGGADALNLASIASARGAQLFSEANRQAVEYAARYPLIAREGVRITSEMADEAERIRKSFERLSNISRLSAALSGVLGQLGRVGESLADIVSQAGQLADAFADFQASQQKTGKNGIFANLGNFTSALGVLSAGIGIIGGLLGGGNAAEEARARRLENNTQALDRLASQINALAGTAREVQNAQIAAGRLAQSAGMIAGMGTLANLGFEGPQAQIEYVNRLIADLGITFADLNRMAQDLGLEIIRENGTIATDALDELARALGYHASIITTLGSSVDAFRQLQDATNRLYNVQESPQQALNDALAELRKFSGAGVATAFQGAFDSPASRAALQQSLQGLLERIRAGTLSLSDLGTFKDAQAMLSALLRADSALDQFADSAAKANAQLLNVPAGFKAALRRFQASAYETRVPTTTGPRPPTAPPTGPAPVQYQPAAAVPLVIQFAVSGGDDREVIYGKWYDSMQAASRTNPALVPFFAALPPPVRRN
jgi:tape measure domain-containing protein